jgi:hypothetical protein
MEPDPVTIIGTRGIYEGGEWAASALNPTSFRMRRAPRAAASRIRIERTGPVRLGRPFRCPKDSGIGARGRRVLRCADARSRPSRPSRPTVRVRRRTSLTVEFDEKGERSLARLGRVGEAPAYRVGVALVRRVENPDRAQQWAVPVLERPAVWRGHQGEQTHETVTFRSRQDATPDGVLGARLPPTRPSVRAATDDRGFPLMQADLRHGRRHAHWRKHLRPIRRCPYR